MQPILPRPRTRSLHRFDARSLVLFASLRERLAAADVPTPFRGISIAMITAGLMSLAFMGFAGLVK